MLKKCHPPPLAFLNNLIYLENFFFCITMYFRKARKELKDNLQDGIKQLHEKQEKTEKEILKQRKDLKKIMHLQLQEA